MKLFIASFLALFTITAITEAQGRGLKWEKIDGCRIIRNPSNDGDSFHVKANGRETIFRLYFVDCPETSNHNAEMKARVAEQSSEFGLPASEVMKLGKRATDFTKAIFDKLPSFTAYTRWENAGGDSSLKRYFAYIIVNGRGLDEQLVENGFARVLGRPVDIPKELLPPKGISGFEHRDKLLKLQKKARDGKKGVWQRSY